MEPVPTSSPADPTRALTPREREAIIALLDRGTNINGDISCENLS